MVCNAQDLQSSTGGSVRSRLIRNILGNETPPSLEPIEAEESPGRPFRRAWEELLMTASALPVRQGNNSASGERSTRSTWRPGGIGYIVDVNGSGNGTSNTDSSFRQERRRSIVRQMVEQNIVFLRRANNERGSFPDDASAQSVLGRRRREDVNEGQLQQQPQEYDDIPTYHFTVNSNQSPEDPRRLRSGGMISFPLSSNTRSVEQTSGASINISSGSARTTPNRQQATVHQNIFSSWFPFTTNRTRSSSATERGSEDSRINLPGQPMDLDPSIDGPQPYVRLSNSFETRDARLLTLRRQSSRGEANNGSANTAVIATTTTTSNNSQASVDRTPLYRLLRDNNARRQQQLETRQRLQTFEETLDVSRRNDRVTGEITVSNETVDPGMMRRLIRVIAGTEQTEVAPSDGTERPLC